MARAPRALLLAAALVPARGELRILDGEYAGRSLPSPLHHVSADHFDVTAELVASNGTQWLQDSCPPTHVGKQPIEGRLVLFDFQPLVCSRESLARALNAYGAAGMISLGERSGLVPPVPGRSVYSYSNGDTREQLPLPMAFIAGELAHDIYQTIASGAPVRARLTPSPNIWINMWASPWWAVWQATLTVQSVIVLEVALMRLYAFVREDQQPRLTIPQALLFIESLAHVQRIAFTAVDPYWSRGIYTDETAIWLLTNHLALASIGRALFLVYYAQSAMVMGILTARVSQPSWAATLVGVCIAVLAVDVLSSAFALHSLALTWVRVILSTTIIPTVELVLFVLAYWRMVRKLKFLPPAQLNRVKTVMGRACLLSMCAVVTGIVIPFFAISPVSLAVIVFLFRSSVNAVSLVLVMVFKPLTVTVLVGPFGFLANALRAALTLAAAYLRIRPEAVFRRVRLMRYSPSRTSSATGVQVAPLPAEGQATNSTVSAAGGTDEPPDWPKYGITLRFAREYIAALDLNALQSTAEVGRKMRASFACVVGASTHSAVDLYRDARTLDGNAAVGEASVFVIHSPAIPFTELVDALAGYAQQHGLEPQQTFWIGIFSRRQLPLSQRNLNEAVRVMREVGRVALVLERWDGYVPLGLLAQALQLEGGEGGNLQLHVRIALTERERSRFARALTDAPDATREMMLRAVPAHALEDASHTPPRAGGALGEPVRQPAEEGDAEAAVANGLEPTPAAAIELPLPDTPCFAERARDGSAHGAGAATLAEVASLPSNPPSDHSQSERMHTLAPARPSLELRARVQLLLGSIIDEARAELAPF